MATCFGCGQLLGLRSEEECTCWLSVTEKAIIPERLAKRTVQIRRLREGHK